MDKARLLPMLILVALITAGVVGGTYLLLRDGDSANVDTDGDGVIDTEDEFPTDPDEWTDTDGDGVGDNADSDDNTTVEDNTTGDDNTSTDNDSCEGIECEDYCEGKTRYYEGECVDGVCQYSSEECEHGCEDGNCTGWQVGESVDIISGSGSGGGAMGTFLDTSDYEFVDYVPGIKFGRKWSYVAPTVDGSVHWTVSDSAGEVWSANDDIATNTLSSPEVICPMTYDNVTPWSVGIDFPNEGSITFEYEIEIYVCGLS